MRETITWSQEELKRWHLLKMEQEERITLREAARRMGVGTRQPKRLKRAWEWMGRSSWHARRFHHANQHPVAPPGSAEGR